MELKSKIESHLAQHSPFDTISEFTQKKYRDKDTVEAFVQLHNEGKLSLIEIFSKIKNDKSIDFFTVRYLFSDALPHLKDRNIPSLLNTIETIIIEAGDDVASHYPLEDFEKLLNTDLEFSCQIIEHLKTNQYTTRFLTKTLISISKKDLKLSLDKAEEIISLENENLSADVMLALGQINYLSNISLLERSIEIICSTYYQSSNEILISSILHSLIQISTNHLSSYDIIQRKISSIINLTNHSIRTVHVCMVQLFYHIEKLPTIIKVLLLETIPFIESSSTGTIKYLDMLLPKLFNENCNQALTLLENFLIHTEYKTSLDNFNTFTSYLFKNENQDKLSLIFTRWFLSRKISLNYFASKLLNNHELEAQFDTTQLINQFSQDHFFLAKKACGWCFMNPTTAISLIFSVFKVCPDNQNEKIAEIVFNPLCISYPSKVTEYLNKYKEQLSTKKLLCVEKILEKLEKYHQRLEASYSLKELRISPSEHFEYRRHHQQSMNKAYAEARKKSVFAGLFTENTLLYGKSTAFIIQTSEGSQRQTMPLQSFSRKIDFPSMEILDSTSLHHCLLSFKVEGSSK